MQKRWFKIAKTIAMESKGTNRNKNFRHGAVIVYKNQLLAIGRNLMKTHPVLASISRWPFQHAESNAIIRRGLDNCKGLDLYSVRITQEDEYTMSLPCASCQQLIISVEIENVYYSDWNGNFMKWTGAPTYHGKRALISK